jgi:serine/threonine protein kinase
VEEKPDSDPLLPVAEAIADGRRVDWHKEITTHSGESDILACLQAVESVKAAHRMSARASAPREDKSVGAEKPVGSDRETSPSTRSHRDAGRLLPDDLLASRYRILAFLGHGGMGEVYKARDTRLERTVAIKVVTAHRSGEPEHRARLHREARAVSQLNHPNICAVYDNGEHDGFDFIVFEHLEGETLAARLRRGPFPLKQLWPVAIEIADALSHAHRSGITHRDLKPSNIILTKSGAKLVDFGLARVAQIGPVSPSPSDDPAQADPITAKGMLLGTLPYMAPEQLEGHEADPRSDLWAFGAVLYEMTTGKRAFDGESQASLIGAIMNQEPPPMSQLAPAVPPAHERLVRACLAKDPDDRLQTAHDIRLQLEWIRDYGWQQSTTAAPSRSIRKRVAWALASVAVLAVATLAFLQLARSRDSGAISLSITAPPGTELYNDAFSASPDGRSVAFLARRFIGASMWIRSIDSVNAKEIAGTRGAMGDVFWSPDGRFLGVFIWAAGNGFLNKITIDGGTPTQLCSAPGALGGSWNRRGDIILGVSGGPICRTTADGGELRPVTKLDTSRGEISHRFPVFLPDGDHFLFAALPTEPDGYPIYVGSLTDTRVKKIMNADSSPIFAPPGYLVFTREQQVMALRFDTRHLELEGEPVTITAAPALSQIEAEPVATASGNGRLFILGNERSKRTLSWLDRDGAAGDTLPLPEGYWRLLRLSPDERLACAFNNGYWVIDLTRSSPTRVGISPSEREVGMAWSPDGQRLAFASNISGRGEIYLANADGTGEPELLPTSDAQFKTVHDWSPDGRYLVFGAVSPSSGWDIWILPMTGDRKPELYASTPHYDSEARISPDGRWIAFKSLESGLSQVFIQSFPKAGYRVRVPRDWGRLPRWSQGGRELIYQFMDNVMTVPIDQGAVPTPGIPRLLFRDPRGWRVTSVLEFASEMEFSSDGQRILSSTPVHDERREIKAILNWTKLMKP